MNQIQFSGMMKNGYLRAILLETSIQKLFNTSFISHYTYRGDQLCGQTKLFVILNK